MRFDTKGRFTLTPTPTGYRITDTVAARPEAAIFSLTVSPHYEVGTKAEAQLAVDLYLSTGRWGLPEWYRDRETVFTTAHHNLDGGQVEVRRNVSRRRATALHREQQKAIEAAKRLQERIRAQIERANQLERDRDRTKPPRALVLRRNRFDG